MLNPSEKAYCQALLALRRKDWRRAHEHFETAAPEIRNNPEFTLLKESTALLLAVQDEIARLEQSGEELQVEEVFSNG